MADLQPPKQAPEDPGAHELDGNDPPSIATLTCRIALLTPSRIFRRPLLLSIRGRRRPTSKLELKSYHARGAR